MENQIIREDAFPFVCENPQCLNEHDVEAFCGEVNRKGLIYFYRGKVVYQGIYCADCKIFTLKPYTKENAPVNLDYFQTTLPFLCPGLFPPEEQDAVDSSGNEYPGPEAVCSKCRHKTQDLDPNSWLTCKEQLLWHQREDYLHQIGAPPIEFHGVKIDGRWKSKMNEKNSGSQISVSMLRCDIIKLRNLTVEDAQGPLNPPLQRVKGHAGVPIQP